MGKRGRPRHPDILTPREWEVLAFIRDGLTNEEIATRLGISIDGAKFHVGQILSKLGVSSRQEAAAWQPDSPSGRFRAVALLGPLSRLRFAGSPAAVSAGVAGTLVLIALVALAVLGVLVSRSRGDEATSVQAPTPTPGPSLGVAPTPIVALHPVWGWNAGWQIDENTGWLAGVACPSNVNREGCVGMIEKTEDGGETWEEQYRGPLNVYAMQLADAERGWAAGSGVGCDDGRACPSTLLATNDGGATWSEVFRADHQVLQLSLTAVDGWLLTQQVADCGAIEPCVNNLLRSSDGGRTWTTSTLPLDGFSFSLSRPSVDDAWISSGSEVAVTHDGGQTWTRLEGPALTNEAYPSSVFFLPSGQGWLLVGSQPGAGSEAKELFGTDDGGVTWHSLSGTLDINEFRSGLHSENELGWGGYVGQMLFTSPQEGWLTLARAGLLHTADGGATWEWRVNPDDSAGVLTFSDPAHGWAIFHNVPQQTSDGETWTPIKTPPPLP